MMSRVTNWSSEGRETGRVEAFSDGVFAIAITLLVLELKVPHLEGVTDRRALGDALLHLWPSFAAFLTSFVAILIMWMNHHGVFRMVNRVSGPFLGANGFLLLTVTFVPFPTAVLASHVLGPSSTIAAAFYCGTYILVSIGYNALWSAATRGGPLVEKLMVSYQEKHRKVIRESKIKIIQIEAVQENKEFKNLHTEIYSILKESKEK